MRKWLELQQTSDRNGARRWVWKVMGSEWDGGPRWTVDSSYDRHNPEPWFRSADAALYDALKHHPELKAEDDPNNWPAGTETKGDQRGIYTGDM